MVGVSIVMLFWNGGSLYRDNIIGAMPRRHAPIIWYYLSRSAAKSESGVALASRRGSDLADKTCQDFART